MTIYVQQVAPEVQESPLILTNEYPANVVVGGNRDYNLHTCPVYDRVFDALNARLFPSDADTYDPYDSLSDAINDLLPPENSRGAYSTDEMIALIQLYDQYWACASHTSKERDTICSVLSIVTGGNWTHTTIRGCCQNDWQYLLCDAKEYSDEFVKAFECEYFNTGTEWACSFSEDGDDSVCFYFHDDPYSRDDFRKLREEVRDVMGCPDAEVVIDAFEGYVRVPKYRRIKL